MNSKTNGRPKQEKQKFKSSSSTHRRIDDFGVRNKLLNKAQKAQTMKQNKYNSKYIKI